MKKNILFVPTFLVLFLVSTATVLAYSNDNLKINSDIKEVWNINYQDVLVTEGSVIGDVRIAENGTNIEFNANLNKPGDFYEFTVDIVNKGSSDAVIDSINKTVLTDAQKRYLYYNVTNADLKDLKHGQVLKAGNKCSIKVRLEYKKDITSEMLPKETQNIEFSFNVNFIEK